VQNAVQTNLQNLVQKFVQENGSDAETGCRNRADVGAVIRAEFRADEDAENGNDTRQFVERMQRRG